MSDASDAVNELNQQLERTDSLLTSIVGKTKAIGGNVRGSGNSLIANQTAPVVGGGGVNVGGGGGGGGGSSIGSGGMFDPGAIPDFKNADVRASRRSYLAAAGMGTVSSLASMLPSTQEAMTFDALANRLHFYGNAAATKNIGQTFQMQLDTAKLGTATSATDVASAAMQGAGQGLLPGLSNYNATASSFGGILGGAALASNLTPGLGFQGGMAAMAGLNTARNVNMLRMIGVSVRNNEGQMNDLPDVIGQIYKMLKQSAGQEPTAQMIAVSAMSGNALDSILNTYFGNDSSLRQTVLSGLLQMANSGGASLRTSGTSEALSKTGGTTATVQSLARRNTAEQRMIQQWTHATNAGFALGNEVLTQTYTGLANLPNTPFGGTFNTAQLALSATDTIGGARNGAGGLMTEALTGGTAGLLGDLTKFLPKSGIGKLAAGTLALAATNSLGSQFDPNYGLGTGNQNYSAVPTGTPPTIVGNVTVNVTAPASVNPNDWANQLNIAIVNAARS